MREGGDLPQREGGRVEEKRGGRGGQADHVLVSADTRANQIAYFKAKETKAACLVRQNRGRGFRSRGKAGKSVGGVGGEVDSWTCSCRRLSRRIEDSMAWGESMERSVAKR